MAAKVNKQQDKKKPGGGGGGRKGGGGGKEADDGGNLFKREEVLQAVLLADSFKVKFRPVTLQRPKVLLPLVNVPMIDYTLEFLVSGGVKEILVVCRAHADAISDYLKQSKWSKGEPAFRVETINAPYCDNEGDALRLLDQGDHIKGNFVLVSGDVISNIKLAPLVAAHKARAAANKNNILTCTFKKAAPKHRTRTLDDELVTAIDAATGQLLLYENKFGEKKVTIENMSTFEQHPTVQFRMDLMDARIYICSPEVLARVSENPDQKDLDMCVRGLLQDEVYGDMVHAHVISNEYAARVDDLFTYDAVSKDVIRRWTYPIVPDNNFLSKTSYTFARGNVYREKNIVTARTTVIGNDSVIGGGTELGANTEVRQSVIARDCKIGNNVRIVGSYLLGACVVEDGAVIDRAILCDGVIVRRNAKVERGCILSYQVVVGAGHVVPPQTKLVALSAQAEAELFEKLGGGGGLGDDGAVARHAGAADADAAGGPGGAGGWPRAAVGDGGVGRVFEDRDESENGDGDDDDDEADQKDAKAERARKRAMNSMAPDPVVSDAEDDDWLAEFEDDDMRSKGSAGSAADDKDSGSDVDDAHGAAPGGPAGGAGAMDRHEHNRLLFFREALETLRRGNEENLDPDAIVLEMSSLKLSHDASVTDYARGVLSALFAFAGVQPTEEARAAQRKAAGASPVKAGGADAKGKPAAAPAAPAAAAAANSKADAKAAAGGGAAAKGGDAKDAKAGGGGGAAAAAAAAADAKAAKTEHAAVMKRFVAAAKRWKQVLTKFGRAKADQIRFIDGLESLCRSDEPRYAQYFNDALEALYDNDICNEPACKGWEAQRKAAKTADEKLYLSRAAVFLDWLRTAKEEDSD